MMTVSPSLITRMFFHLNDLNGPGATAGWHQSCIVTVASTLREFKHMDHTDVQAIADMPVLRRNSSETYHGQLEKICARPGIGNNPFSRLHARGHCCRNASDHARQQSQGQRFDPLPQWGPGSCS